MKRILIVLILLFGISACTNATRVPDGGIGGTAHLYSKFTNLIVYFRNMGERLTSTKRGSLWLLPSGPDQAGEAPARANLSPSYKVGIVGMQSGERETMKNAEAVTFGGSGLNRAAELRGDDTQAELRGRIDAQVTYFGVENRWFSVIKMDSKLSWSAGGIPIVDGQGHLCFWGCRKRCPIFCQRYFRLDPNDLPDSLNQFLDPSEQVHPDLDGHFAELRSIMTSLTARDAELAATARGLLEWHRTHTYCANCGGKI